MAIRLVAVLVFAPVFGIVFIVAGFKRMYRGGPEGRDLESVFWGLLGLLIGVGMIAGVVWLFLGPPES